MMFWQYLKNTSNSSVFTGPKVISRGQWIYQALWDKLISMSSNHWIWRKWQRRRRLTMVWKRHSRATFFLLELLLPSLSSLYATSGLWYLETSSCHRNTSSRQGIQMVKCEKQGVKTGLSCYASLDEWWGTEANYLWHLESWRIIVRLPTRLGIPGPSPQIPVFSM